MSHTPPVAAPLNPPEQPDSPPLSLRWQFRRLRGDILAFSPGNTVAVAGLMLLAAVLEGSGLMILAPMLSLVGMAANTGAGAAGSLAAIFKSVGLSLSIGSILVTYLLLIALHALVAWRRDVSAMHLQQGFVDHLRLQLYRDVGAAEWSFLARTDSAELSHTLVTDLGRISLGLAALLQLLTTGAMVAAYLLIAFSLSVPLTGITLVVGALLLSLLRRRHVASHAGGYRLTDAMRSLHGEVSEFLAGLKLVKSSNLESAAIGRYQQLLQVARRHAVEFAHRQALSRSLLHVGGAGALAVLIYAALVVMHLAPASVLVLVFVFSRLFPFLSTMQQHYERLLYNLPAYASFDAMRAQCEAAAEPKGSGQPVVFERQITLQDLHYRPPGADDDILRGVTLTIRSRSTVALIGPSGAGKSTLADLLGGLLAPSAGSLLIDGQTLVDRRAWRQQVAYVSQDSFLLNASVRENLRWTNPAATEAELQAALSLAAADFVIALPQGLDTVLGERGVRLSGGERQRLAIARALLRRPLLLILDEATSALDRDNERRIQESVSRLHGQLTILVIAHRLDTVRDADQLFVVEDGRVRESGTFQQLLAAEAGYLSRMAAASEPTNHA